MLSIPTPTLPIYPCPSRLQRRRRQLRHQSRRIIPHHLQCAGRLAKRRTILHFGGIYSAASVWVNGQYVGYTQGSNNTSEFDISPYLKPGDNTLAVEVMRWSDGSYLECQDMFRMSGIFRDVTLRSLPPGRQCATMPSPPLSAPTTHRPM